MGSSYKIVFGHRHLYFLLSFLLLSTSTQQRFMAEGSIISRLLEVAKGGGEEKMLMRARIGSRPPSCEKRCRSCGHCEAIQVPAVPQDGRGRRQYSSVVSTITSRGDDTTNYKPMSWKCKCGDMILNP